MENREPNGSADPNQELVELVPRPMLFPDENEMTYEGLHDALLNDLAPSTPYETVLAENLITLEWEAIRHRQMRDSQVKAAFRDFAMGVFEDGEIGRVASGSRSGEAAVSAYQLVRDDEEARLAAERKLAESWADPSEIVAKAYDDVREEIEVHERKLAQIEVRRRRLREDYDRVKSPRRRKLKEVGYIDH